MSGLWSNVFKYALVIAAAVFLGSVALRAYNLMESSEGPGRWAGVAGLAAVAWLVFRMVRLLMGTGKSSA